MTTIRNIVDEMRQGTAYCEYWRFPRRCGDVP